MLLEELDIQLVNLEMLEILLNIENTSWIPSTIFFKTCGFPVQQFAGGRISSEKDEVIWIYASLMSPVELDFHKNT